jgi:hypothetical protein
MSRTTPATQERSMQEIVELVREKPERVMVINGDVDTILNFLNSVCDKGEIPESEPPSEDFIPQTQEIPESVPASPELPSEAPEEKHAPVPIKKRLGIGRLDSSMFKITLSDPSTLDPIEEEDAPQPIRFAVRHIRFSSKPLPGLALLGEDCMGHYWASQRNQGDFTEDLDEITEE